MKKCLGVLLIVLMILQSVPIAVFAEEVNSEINEYIDKDLNEGVVSVEEETMSVEMRIERPNVDGLEGDAIDDDISKNSDSLPKEAFFQSKEVGHTDLAANAYDEVIANVEFAARPKSISKSPLPIEFEYEGDINAFITREGGIYDLLSVVAGEEDIIEDKIHVIWRTNSKAVYSGFYINALIDDPTTWKEEYYISASEWHTIDGYVKYGVFEFDLSKEYCGKAVAVAPINATDGSTSDFQYYLAFMPENLWGPQEWEWSYSYSIDNEEVTIIRSTYITAEEIDLVIPATIEGYPVVSIGYEAFYGCTSLKSVIIPESVRSIGDKAFYSCTGLISITIPESVISIGKYAFYNCSKLPSINISESVTTIGNSAFVGCTSLTSITIPDSVTAIGDCVFADCTELTRIIIPDGVQTIGRNAFQRCSNLTEVLLPESAQISIAQLFEDCYMLSRVIWNARIPVGIQTDGGTFTNAGRDSKSGLSVVFGEKVECLPEGMFAYNAALIEVVLPKSLREIGSGAFSNCIGLTSLTIPENVTIIGDYAFEGCTSIKELFFNAQNAYMERPWVTFFDVGKLSNTGLRVVFGKNVEIIPRSIFSDCNSLTEVVISSNVTQIGPFAFSECANLARVIYNVPYILETDNLFTNAGIDSNTGFQVYFGDEVNRIPSGMFNSCSALTNVTMSNGIREIGISAFSGCVGLTKLELGEGIYKIGDFAFNSCTGLKEVTLPGSLTSIGVAAFGGCSELESVVITEGITSLANSVFENCVRLYKVSIPISVTEIGYGAFQNCTRVGEVFYEGSPSAWNAISISGNNDPLVQATIHYEKEDPVPAFKSQSLVLSGQIGLNFFLELPEIPGVDYSKSYMTFTIGKDPTEYRDNFDPNHMNSGKTRYGFTCYVNSIQMADTIKAVFHYGVGKTVSKDYSVSQYIDFFEKNIGSFNAKTIALIRAIADFGHYEQIYLADVNGWTIGDKYAEMATHYTDTFDYASILSAVNDKAFVKSLGSSNVEKASYKLHLDSETTVDVFLTPKSGKTLTASATFNGKTYKAVKQSDGRYLVQIPNISAHQLGEMITVTGTAGTSFSVKVSALSYTRSVLNNASSNTAAKDGLSALYQYYVAVLGYRS